MSRFPPPLVRLSLVSVMLLAACSPGPSASGQPSPGPSVQTVPAGAALDAIGSMGGGFSCGEPVPRQDDFMWICQGARDVVTATIHLYATKVDSPVFGATLYTSAPSTESEGAASATTRQMALDLVNAVVPEPWQEATRAWVGEHMDGGRTLDVPNAGITAAVQPLTGLQWYLEFYELDGLEG